MIFSSFSIVRKDKGNINLFKEATYSHHIVCNPGKMCYKNSKHQNHNYRNAVKLYCTKDVSFYGVLYYEQLETCHNMTT